MRMKINNLLHAGTLASFLLIPSLAYSQTAVWTNFYNVAVMAV